MTTDLNCFRCAELLALLADNDRWQREVLSDFEILSDDHTTGRRLAFTHWMKDRLDEIQELHKQVEDLQRQLNSL